MSEASAENIDKKRKAGDSPPEQNVNLVESKKQRSVPVNYLEPSSSEDEEKRRTPSGNVLEKKVGDIRNFFSTQNADLETSKGKKSINSQSLK